MVGLLHASLDSLMNRACECVSLSHVHHASMMSTLRSDSRDAGWPHRIGALSHVVFVWRGGTV